MLDPSNPSSYSETLLTFGICGSSSASGLRSPEWVVLPMEVGVREALVELLPSFVPMLLPLVDLAGDVAGVLSDGLLGVRFSVAVVVVED